MELSNVKYDSNKRQLHVSVVEQAGESYTIEFIGSRFLVAEGEAASTNQPPTSAARRVAPGPLGVVLARHQSPMADYVLKGDELYVRAVITSSASHVNPSLPNQRQQAWTQPVGWRIGP